MSEKVSHFRYQVRVSEALFSTSKIKLKAKNQSKRPVQSEKKIYLILFHSTQRAHFQQIRWVIPEKTKADGPSLRSFEFLFWYLTRFSMSKKLSHLRYIFGIGKELSSTSQIQFNTKKKSNAQYTLKSRALCNKFSEASRTKPHEHSLRSAEFVFLVFNSISDVRETLSHLT